MTNYTQTSRREPTPYFARLQNWLGGFMSGHDMPLYHGNVLDPARSDMENYLSCLSLYESAGRSRPQATSQSPAHNPAKDYIQLKLHTDGNVTRVYDMSKGSMYAKMIRDPDTGSVSYFGPVEGLTRFGGRDEFKSFWVDSLDAKWNGGYFQDGKQIRP